MYQAKTDPRKTRCAIPLLGSSDRSVSPATTKPTAIATPLATVIARDAGDRRCMASTRGSNVQATNVTMLAIPWAESAAVASGSFVGSGQHMSLHRKPPARIVPTPATRSSARVPRLLLGIVSVAVPSVMKPGIMTTAERVCCAASPLTWWRRWEYPVCRRAPISVARTNPAGPHTPAASRHADRWRLTPGTRSGLCTTRFASNGSPRENIDTTIWRAGSG